MLELVDVISMGRLASACLKRRASASWFVMLRPLPPALSFDTTQPMAVCG